MGIQEFEKDFREKTILLLNNFPNYPEGTFDLNKELKDYIYSDLNNPHVKKFIKQLATRYLKIFTNQNLINAFKLPISHYRDIQIYANLPLTQNIYYGNYLYNLFNFKSKKFYDMCRALFELAEINTNEIQEVFKIIDRCEQFEDEHKELMKASKDVYLEPAKEIESIVQVSKEIDDYMTGKIDHFSSTIKNFAFTIPTNDEEFAARKYKRKVIGKLGEYYAYEYAKDFDYSVFVAKDLKDGFGYDIYFLDNGIETLVEVKTTAKSLEDANEYFTLSKNEFRVMKDCLTNKNTKYLIVRIGLNEDYTVQNIVVLETNDGITFNSRNVEGYCYRFREFNHEDEAIFYRTVQKLKQK